MAISKNVFEQLSDKIGVQVRSLCSGIDAARSPGGTLRYKMIHSGIGTDGDYTAENALIASAKSIDDGTGLDRRSHVNTGFNSVLAADNTYAVALGFSNLDGYLWQSGINVSPEYNLAKYYTGGAFLNAVDVFGPVVSPMGTLAFTASGVSSFTAGTAVGTGTGAASDTNHAAANIEVVVCSGLGVTNPIHLDIFATIEGGTSGTTESRTLTLDLAGTETVGEKFTVGTIGNKGDMALAITNIKAAGGNNGDALVVQSIMERTIHV